MTFTYGAVDESADPGEAHDWQERVDAWPQIRTYKARTYERLGPDGPVLDVGCGPGGDLEALGRDRAIGVDLSMVMCRGAFDRAPVAASSATALPFGDDTLAGARADRVIQHVDDPVRALQEMVRVVRPGGRVVVADPDQETLLIHVPGVPDELTDRVKAMRRDIGYRNGRFASRLAEGLQNLEVVDIEIAGFPLVLTDPDDAFGLPTWPEFYRERGLGDFTPADVEAWDDGMARSRSEPGFVYALLYLVVSGTVA